MLLVTEIDFETSGASVRRTDRSKLGLLLEQNLRNCCIIRVILRGTLGFLHLTQAVWGAAELVITGIDPQTSDASACRIQRSQRFDTRLENCLFVLLESSSQVHNRLG